MLKNNITCKGRHRDEDPTITQISHKNTDIKSAKYSSSVKMWRYYQKKSTKNVKY